MRRTSWSLGGGASLKFGQPITKHKRLIFWQLELALMCYNLTAIYVKKMKLLALLLSINYASQCAQKHFLSTEIS